MSLLAQVRAGLDQAWEALGDLKSEAVYRRVTRGAYNPSTGIVAQTVSNTSLTVGLVDYTDQQRSSSDIQSGDMRVLMRAKDLPFKPEDEDQIVEADGTTWTVKQVMGDKRLFWDLRVRR